MRTVRGLVTTVALLTFATGLRSCGGDTKADCSGPVNIDITFKDGKVSPVGKKVDACVGEDVNLKITADVAGEIHVHSDPEQELSYAAGTETLSVRIDRPGLVAVESHDLDQVIVQLAVK